MESKRYAPLYRLSMQERLDLMELQILAAVIENDRIMAQPVEVPKVGTAKANALLWDETIATAKQWKRARKRGLKMGVLVIE